MIPSCWKGQIACVSELSIEQECLSGVCRPPLLRAFPWEGKGGGRGCLRMIADEKIKNSSELEFAVFCIENVAAKLGVNAERVYQAFTEQSDILNGYIVPALAA